MPEKYQDYLAANVLNQGGVISYRSLARAVKVHSNAAKEMLYQFHRTQNSRKPGSLHATYLVCGTRKPQSSSQPNGTHSTDGDDTLMSDGSFMLSSSMPDQEANENHEIPATTITLVAEEQFEQTKIQYEKITSIHIYSLEPGPLSNIHILSDCNRKIAVDYASEDPLETWKQYGTIHNPNVTRRTSRRPPPPLPAPTTAHPTVTPAVQSKPAETTKAATSKPIQPKRESSDIFKSFAKSKAEPAKEQRVGAHSNPPGSLGPSKPEPPTAEDESMKDIPDIPSEADDEGDDEEEESAQDIARRKADATAAKQKADANRKAKLEREANLRKMMDDDDDDDHDNNNANKTADQEDENDTKDADGDESMAEADADADAHDAPVDAPPIAQPEADHHDQQVTTSSNGRRRGRRRVMKKKTTKDAEGYLVTKEEAVWESFSEDEPVAPAASRKPPISAAGAVGGNKAKKPASSGSNKAGQGNIMSFFGKK